MFALTPRRLAGAAIGTGLLAAAAALASSHSDAPIIKQDPQANLTDVYAFIGTKFDDPDETMLNVIANVRPFSEPGDGPHYDRFADDAVYSIHITVPSTGEELIRYDFEFSSVDGPYKNSNTILSYGLGTEVGAINAIGDARQNYTQTYSVSRTEGGSTHTIGADLLAGIPNVGSRVTPSYKDADGRAVSGLSSEEGLKSVITVSAFRSLLLLSSPTAEPSKNSVASAAVVPAPVEVTVR